MTEPGSCGNGATNSVRAAAKINLFLLVGEKRADGYHPVCSLMEKVTLYDDISVRSTGREGVRILGTSIPPPENTIFRAAGLLERETGVVLDIEVTLEKRIPVAAGLAGGSSDAAAVLVLLNRVYGLSVESDRLLVLAREIGADVPFFLTPGPLVAEGAGELLASPGEIPGYHAVIVKPDIGLSTAEVYDLYDEVAGSHAAAFSQRRQEHLERLAGLEPRNGSLASLLRNDLELPAAELCPEIPGIKAELLALGADGALMSGSGPSVFGLFAGENDAAAALEKLRKKYQHAWRVRPLRDKCQ